MKRAVIIFAAGQGTRMKSAIPKVLHTIAHKAMLHYVIDLAQSLSPEQVVIICSPFLKDYLEKNAASLGIDRSNLTLTVQDPPKGTGHAMQVGIDALHNDIDEVIVLYGDVPLVKKETLSPLLADPADICFVSMRVAPPHAYGRIITYGTIVKRIVEFKDATENERAIDLVWSGVLKSKVSFLKDFLPKIPAAPNTGEYYLTHLAVMAGMEGRSASYVEAPDADEFEGVNDKAALSQMESRKQCELRAKFLNNGVKLIAPETVFFAHDTVIGEDVTIEPFVTFGKGVILGQGSLIRSFCHIEDSIIEENVHIGPFAHLRGHNHIENDATIGNFVEVKKSRLSKGAKAKHLAYLGDAEIGADANIGAGAITCNYDGHKKHKTIIGARSLVGVNATLIAPLTIGDDSVVGAGSVITDDVPSKTLALARSRQTIKERHLKK